MSILISHEIPKQLFQYSRWINDYPYVLGHLLWKGTEHYDAEYAEFYREELRTHKFSILDNSGFELGSSIPNEVLYELGEEYKPSHLILPDVAFKRKETLERSAEYVAEYGRKSTPKFIGCIQGQGLGDMHEVYDIYQYWTQVDLIAVSCCIVEREETDKMARFKYVEDLIAENGKLPKKLHLLGCKHPNEFMRYNADQRESIHSVDTSAPIIYGWNDVEFPNKGLDLNIKKPGEKLADNLNKILSENQLNLISRNIRSFRSYINR